MLDNMHVSRGILRVTAMYSLLVMSFLLRVIWLLMKEANVCTNKERNPTTRALVCPCFMVLRVANRLSMLFCFSAFSVVAIFWSEVLSRAKDRGNRRRRGSGDDRGRPSQSENLYGGFGVTDDDSEATGDSGPGGEESGLVDGTDSHLPNARKCCSPQTTFTLINVWVYIIEIVVLCFTAFGHLPDETYDLIRDINYIVVASFFFFLTIAMVCVGWSVRNLSKNAGAGMSCKTSIVMMTCALCFSMRSVIFVWQPVTHRKIDARIWNVLDPLFLYPVPDILPAVVLLFAMAPGTARDSDESDDAPSVYEPGDGSWMRQALLRPEVEFVGSINDGESSQATREWF
jgi:hypothetical protein